MRPLSLEMDKWNLLELETASLNTTAYTVVTILMLLYQADEWANERTISPGA
jgi:hypothetical protein